MKRFSLLACAFLAACPVFTKPNPCGLRRCEDGGEAVDASGDASSELDASDELDASSDAGSSVDASSDVVDAGTDADCEHASDCDGRSDAPVCDVSSGSCVECTPETETEWCLDDGQAPGGQGPACDPEAKTCTGERRGSLGTCGRPVTSGDARIVRCVSDSECASGHFCVPTTFNDAAYGNYCLLVAQGGTCSAPWPRALDATSVGGIARRYCFPRELLTTCEAIVEFGAACSLDDDCGREGFNDGHCESGRCTYACSGPADCNGTICQDFDAGRYCNPF